jgi:uncharacterized cupredoxin-like copper-binding protein
MRPIRSTFLTLVLVATAAACGSSATTAPQPTAAAALAQPTAAQPASPAPATAAPIAVTPAPTSPSHTQTISLYEWKVIAATTLKAGKTTFTISNFGTIPHELLVFKSKLPLSSYPTDKAGDIKEEGPGVTLLSDGVNIDPAGAQVRTVDLSPGTYVFMCNIPSHFKQGMYAVVTVTK